MKPIIHHRVRSTANYESLISLISNVILPISKPKHILSPSSKVYSEKGRFLSITFNVIKQSYCTGPQNHIKGLVIDIMWPGWVSGVQDSLAILTKCTASLRQRLAQGAGWITQGCSGLSACKYSPSPHQPPGHWPGERERVLLWSGCGQRGKCVSGVMPINNLFTNWNDEVPQLSNQYLILRNWPRERERVMW